MVPKMQRDIALKDEKEKAALLEENASIVKGKNRLLEAHAEETTKSVQTIAMQAEKITQLEDYALFMHEKNKLMQEKNMWPLQIIYSYINTE